MAYLGEAGHDEQGRYNSGAAGDQSGSECYYHEFYNYPWDCYIEPTDDNIGNKIANAMIEACENDLIGYDQYQRNTAYTMFKKYGSIGNIKERCETDCSAVTSLCIVQSGIDILKGLTNAPTTWTLKNILLNTKQFKIVSKPINRGTILLNEQHHVAIYLGNDTKKKNSNDDVIKTIIKKMDKGVNDMFLFEFVDGKYKGRLYICDNFTIKHVGHIHELEGYAKAKGVSLDELRKSAVKTSIKAPYHERFLALCNREKVIKW